MQFPVDQIVTIVVAVLGSTWFSSWIQNRASKTKKQLEETKVQLEENHKALEILKEANLATLHDRLYYLGKKYIDAGCISPDDYENLIQLYDPYLKLHGDGTVENMMEQIKKMGFTTKSKK